MGEAFLIMSFTRLSYSPSFSWKGSPYTIFLSSAQILQIIPISLRMGLHFTKLMIIYITFVKDQTLSTEWFA